MQILNSSRSPLQPGTFQKCQPCPPFSEEAPGALRPPDCSIFLRLQVRHYRACTGMLLKLRTLVTATYSPRQRQTREWLEEGTSVPPNLHRPPRYRKQTYSLKYSQDRLYEIASRKDPSPPPPLQTIDILEPLLYRHFGTVLGILNSGFNQSIKLCTCKEQLFCTKLK